MTWRYVAEPFGVLTEYFHYDHMCHHKDVNPTTFIQIETVAVCICIKKSCTTIFITTHLCTELLVVNYMTKSLVNYKVWLLKCLFKLWFIVMWQIESWSSIIIVLYLCINYKVVLLSKKATTKSTNVIEC